MPWAKVEHFKESKIEVEVRYEERKDCLERAR